MKPVTFARESLDEITDAAAWYDGKRQGLGAELLEDVESVLAALPRRHASFPRLDLPIEPVIRRALLARFPYALVFLELDSELRVLAVAHAKREPGCRLHRLR